MSLDPSPLSPQPTPLLHPTDPVPGRGSALVGALISVALAVVVGLVAVRAGTALIFLPQGVGAHAQGVVDQLPQIQGFDYYWAHSFTPAKYGYDHADINAKNLTDQAKNYHMNLVVITVTANEAYTPTGLNPNVGYQSSLDTYSDKVYTDLITAAQAAGLTPAIKLDIRTIYSPVNNTASTLIGSLWVDSVGTEQIWFNSYTDFAVHYAQMAQKLNVPLMIIGHDLAAIATDATSSTLAGYVDAKGNPAPKPCENFAKCYGRHDAEWRHVINAIHNNTYSPLNQKQVLPGGGYKGKLTFAATIDTSGALTIPEYEAITWWDALDIIGVDAYFPLTISGNVSADVLKEVWQGQDTSGVAKNKESYVNSLKKVHDRYTNLPLLFTSVGYESASGANGNPGQLSIQNNQRQDTEQVNDMQALLATFSGKTWWLGVIWAADYPISPRSVATDTPSSGPNSFSLNEPSWSTNTEWAGDCLQDSQPPCDNPEKEAGKWLRNYYKPAPLQDTFWQSLHV